MTLADRTTKWHQAGPLGTVRADQVAQRQTWQPVEPGPEAAREPGFAPDSVIHVNPANIGWSHGMGWHTQTEAAISEEGGDHYLPVALDRVLPAGRIT